MKTTVISFLCLFVLILNNGYAQTVPENDSLSYYFNKKGEKIYLNPDKLPEFPGGEAAMIDFLCHNLRYPSVEGYVQGRVVVQCVVQKNGLLTDFEIARSLHSAFDKEALRVMQSMPCWNPAIVGDSLVNARVILPISFVLRSDDSGDALNIPQELVDEKKISSEDDWKSASIVAVEQMPMFPKGEKALMEYISAQVKYPPQAIKDVVEGKVITRFIVSETGEIKDVQVMKSLSPECDLEAVRAIRCMPTWTPGKQNGKFVAIYYTLPITFALGK